MDRKKKRPLLTKVFIGFFKSIWWVLKMIWKLYYYLGTKISTKSEKIKSEKKEKKKEEIRPKINAKYEKLGLVKTFDGNYSKFEEKLFNNSSVIGIILGARGTGKSAIGMKLIENIKAKTNRNVCAMGFKKESLPSWIHIVSNVEE